MSRHPDIDALAAGLSATGSPLLFATAGEHLASALVRTEALAPEVERLVDVMARRLGDVRRAVLRQTHAPLRIGLAAAAAALGLARPDLQAMAARAIEGFLAPLGPAAWHGGRELLGLRALLSLAIDEVEAASTCVSLLADEADDAVTPVLVRWTLARLGDAPGLEARAWTALRGLARRLDPDVCDRLVVAAALAVRLRSEAARPARLPATAEVPRLA